MDCFIYSCEVGSQSVSQSVSQLTTMEPLSLLVVAFSSLLRILGECSTIYSQSMLFGFF